MNSDTTIRSLRISASIVTYNSDEALLRKTLESLCQSLAYAKSRNRDLHLEVAIVDNSTDHRYRSALRTFVTKNFADRFERLSVIFAEANLGYGCGHNWALLETDSEFHLILNPDVELTENALAGALDFLCEHESVVLVSPRAMSGQGHDQYLGKRYPSVLVLALRGFAPAFLKRWLRDYMRSYEMRDDECNGGARDIPLAGGCCMFARTEALQRAGGFSDSFFMYFEDFDLSLRLLPLGRVVYLPSVEIVHHGGFSARKGLRHIGMFIHSGWKFFQRHGWCWI